MPIVDLLVEAAVDQEDRRSARSPHRTWRRRPRPALRRSASVSYVGQSSFSSRVTPRARREVTANGKKVVWRHAGPPGSVMIGAMTFTSWARLAAVTRSAWRMSEISRLPNTTASTTEYESSSRRGATGHSSTAGDPVDLLVAGLIPDVPLVERDVDRLVAAADGLDVVGGGDDRVDEAGPCSPRRPGSWRSRPRAARSTRGTR